MIKSIEMLKTILTESNEDNSLKNKILISRIPSLESEGISYEIIYVVAHSARGAVGFVLNRASSNLYISDLLDYLDLIQHKNGKDIAVHIGGDVDAANGFILHSTDVVLSDSININEKIALTTKVDFLDKVLRGSGPKEFLFFLGCTVWGPGQLETQIRLGNWLHVDYDDELIFSKDINAKYNLAVHRLGMLPGIVCQEIGNA